MFLGIDVCTGYCSAAVVDGMKTPALAQEPMERGHVERLAPMVDEVIRKAGIAPSDLTGVAVTTGPGSFTGARLGVSFARGLALSLDIPVVGVSVFEALSGRTCIDAYIIALDGKRGSLFVQPFYDEVPVLPPTDCPISTAWKIAPPTGEFDVYGSGADALLDAAPSDVQGRAAVGVIDPVTPDDVARIGLYKLRNETVVPPAPLYLREADAKPQAIVSLG